MHLDRWRQAWQVCGSSMWGLEGCGHWPGCPLATQLFSSCGQLSYAKQRVWAGGEHEMEAKWKRRCSDDQDILENILPKQEVFTSGHGHQIVARLSSQLWASPAPSRACWGPSLPPNSAQCRGMVPHSLFLERVKTRVKRYRKKNL